MENKIFIELEILGYIHPCGKDYLYPDGPTYTIMALDSISEIKDCKKYTYIQKKNSDIPYILDKKNYQALKEKLSNYIIFN